MTRGDTLAVESRRQCLSLWSWAPNRTNSGYRGALAEATTERADKVAVRTDELALGNLGSDDTPGAMHHPRNPVDLDYAW